MNRKAVVVARDESVTRMAVGALRLFKPGYQVINAGTLEDASQRLQPDSVLDLVVVDLDGLSVDEISRWLENHGVESRRVVVIGHYEAELERFGSVIAPGFGLSSLIETVLNLDAGNGVDFYPDGGQNEYLAKTEGR